MTHLREYYPTLLLFSYFLLSIDQYAKFQSLSRSFSLTAALRMSIFFFSICFVSSKRLFRSPSLSCMTSLYSSRIASLTHSRRRVSGTAIFRERQKGFRRIDVSEHIE